MYSFSILFKNFLYLFILSYFILEFIFNVEVSKKRTFLNKWIILLILSKSTIILNIFQFDKFTGNNHLQWSHVCRVTSKFIEMHQSARCARQRVDHVIRKNRKRKTIKSIELRFYLCQRWETGFSHLRVHTRTVIKSLRVMFFSLFFLIIRNLKETII